MQTGVLHLILQAGPVGKSVLTLLLFVSVVGWAIIIGKARMIGRAIEQNGKFLDVFWHSRNIDEIFSKVDHFPSSPVAAVFKSGFKELKKIQATEVRGEPGDAVTNIERAISRASNTEVALLEKHVGILATTASASPFVGLFGTVWGIMAAFQAIGATGAANLAVVAPGIAEALITTAMGIAAAIPAVVAYNHFAGQIKRISVDMENFGQDFLNIIQRNLQQAKR